MIRLEVLHRVVVNALAVLAGAFMTAIALSICVDVFLRACCTSAIFGLGDMIEHGLAAATFLGAPWVLAKNAHVSVDIVTGHLTGKIRRWLDISVNGVGAAASAIFFIYCLKAASMAIQRGSMVRGIVVIPEWLTFAAPVLCTFLLAIGFLLRIARPPRESAVPGL